jgi:hypothetical protein
MSFGTGRASDSAILHQVTQTSSVSEIIRILFSTEGVNWIDVCRTQRRNNTCNDGNQRQ